MQVRVTRPSKNATLTHFECKMCGHSWTQYAVADLSEFGAPILSLKKEKLISSRPLVINRMQSPVPGSKPGTTKKVGAVSMSYDRDGFFDEIKGPCDVHGDRISDQHYWLSFQPRGSSSRVVLNIWVQDGHLIVEEDIQE